MNHREEKDALGTVLVPAEAYYGAQTQRAVENFPISGLRLPPAFIHAVARIKWAAAQVNADLGLLEKESAEAIQTAAREVAEGGLDDQFVVDVFQTGSGTSTNMNVNEVIASRANELRTGRKGGKSPVHPNDHVNLGQSSNDVIPSAIHISARVALHRGLYPSLERLRSALASRAEAFRDVRKIGRTHLQDAVPMTLGQEFLGYAGQMERAGARLASAEARLKELALGGTAVGTGLNTHPEFASRVIRRLSDELGLVFVETDNHFQAQGAQDGAVELSGALKSLAVSLTKIANDIRWLASGPRCGIGEITIPSLQPGSSIMPGKVNPVIPESVLQSAAKVIGNDAVITLAGQSGVFELNVMLPLIAYDLLQSIALLAASAKAFAEKCIDGITANRKVCEGYIRGSLALATSLVPHIGYDRASEIAKKAYAEDKSVPDVAREENVVSDSILAQIFNEGGSHER
jgi:fumarate hydratase class II